MLRVSVRPKAKKPKGGGPAVVELTENNFNEMVLESDEVLYRGTLARRGR